METSSDDEGIVSGSTLLRDLRPAMYAAAGDLRAWIALAPSLLQAVLPILHTARELQKLAMTPGLGTLRPAAERVEKATADELQSAVTALLETLETLIDSLSNKSSAIKDSNETPAGSDMATLAAPGRVLVVQDDDLTVDLIRHRLEQEGFQVAHRDNGTDAVATALATDFDLIILDVKLPGLDGFDVLTRLRSSERHRHTPVIILSSMASAQEAVRGLRRGADDYLRKPFSPSELLARIQRLLRPS